MWPRQPCARRSAARLRGRLSGVRKRAAGGAADTRVGVGRGLLERAAATCHVRAAGGPVSNSFETGAHAARGDRWGRARQRAGFPLRPVFLCSKTLRADGLVSSRPCGPASRGAAAPWTVVRARGSATKKIGRSYTVEPDMLARHMRAGHSQNHGRSGWHR